MTCNDRSGILSLDLLLYTPMSSGTDVAGSFFCVRSENLFRSVHEKSSAVLLVVDKGQQHHEVAGFLPPHGSTFSPLSSAWSVNAFAVLLM